MAANRSPFPSAQAPKEPMDCSALGLGYLVENLQLLQSIGKQGFMQVE